MPIHHNKDGTWQWGQAGKKYRSRKDAIRQMRAIFASGYKEQQDKKASFQGASRASRFLAAVASVGSYGMVKRAADVVNYNSYYQPIQLAKGQTLSGTWAQQRKKNSLVPAYKVFVQDWKRWNKGSTKLMYGQKANLPIYLAKKVVDKIPYTQYGTDQSKWGDIERQNIYTAFLNSLIDKQSRWDVNAISPGGAAIGLGQIQNNKIQDIRKRIPYWKIKDARQLAGNRQGSIYATKQALNISGQGDKTTGRQAINVWEHPQRLSYRFTRGQNAHYNDVLRRRQAGQPQLTEQQLAQADPRVKQHMQLFDIQKQNMPKKPFVRSAPVSTPVTK